MGCIYKQLEIRSHDQGLSPIYSAPICCSNTATCHSTVLESVVYAAISTPMRHGHGRTAHKLIGRFRPCSGADEICRLGRGPGVRQSIRLRLWIHRFLRCFNQNQKARRKTRPFFLLLCFGGGPTAKTTSHPSGHYFLQFAHRK